MCWKLPKFCLYARQRSVNDASSGPGMDCSLRYLETRIVTKTKRANHEKRYDEKNILVYNRVVQDVERYRQRARENIFMTMSPNSHKVSLRCHAPCKSHLENPCCKLECNSRGPCNISISQRHKSNHSLSLDLQAPTAYPACWD